MSWTKPGPGGASPGPPQYGAPQPQPQSYGNQQNVYANYESGVGNVPQQQYWQMGPPQQPPQVQYQQHVQYGQALQELPHNTTQFYQQPAAAAPAPASAAPLFNQNYSNQGYMSPQQNTQQNYYQNQSHQNFGQNAPSKDAWEDNWDWGWDDTAKQAQKAQQNMNRQTMPPQPERAFNNANVIEESFGTNESWNWSMDDKKDNEPAPPQLENSQTDSAAPLPPTNAVQTGNSEVNADANAPTNVNGTRHHVDEVRSLSDRDVIEERLPNLAAGRRLQPDNLTPQWSIESQMSQESSDGPHTHSEGTYRSENQSRNSNSPAPAGDSYSQPSFDDGYPPNDEWSRHSDEPTLAESDHLAGCLHEMTLGNCDNLPAPAPTRRDSRTLLDNVSPSPTASPAAPAVTPPLRAPAPAPAPAAPPPTFPPPTSSHNPFKNAGSFSHKSRAALASPAAVGLAAATAAASRAPLGFEANLETTPDNSERPDRPLASPYRGGPAPPAPPAPPDNLEVAPRSDRNEYMQTAHLSSGAGDYGENAEYAPPPPGLRRLVVGVGEEPPAPPPGLARMVPGRHTEPGERRYRQAEGRPRPPGEAGPEPRLALERGSPGDGAAPPPPPPAGERERRDNVTEGENLQDPEPAAGEPAPPAPPAGAATPDLPGRDSTPQDSDRDRSFEERAEPRRDRDRERPRRDRDDAGRYSRTDRRDRAGDGPEPRRTRRSARHRYETEDTDYYSDRDRDRDRRSHREGSYAGKPPRGDSRRYHASERRYEEERPRDRDRDRDRYERRYRDIDPSRKYGNLRRDRDRDHEQHDRRRVTFSRDAKCNDSCNSASASAGESPAREATATDEDTAWERRDRDRDRDRDRERTRDRDRERERRRRDRERERARPDPYYEAVSQRQYEYYERLRAADPAAYMALYKQLMGGLAGYAAGPPAPAPPYDDRASVHSGRSSAAGLKGTDTYYGCRGEAGSLRDAPSLRTDLSDRDLNTDASLNLQLEESTVRSERMTPFRYSTAHVKGSISSRDVVVVVPSYPVDGAAALVRVVRVSGGARVPPLGPLRAPLAHKRSALEYCAARAAAARAGEGAPDPPGYALVWDLLATMLRQNGVVVGTDLAELLMKNVREFEWRQPSGKSSHNESRRESSVSGSAEEAAHEHERDVPAPRRDTACDDTTRAGSGCAADALDKYREYLIYGNRQEALEWAMSAGLWGHALALAASGPGRERAACAARFLAALPAGDALHTLYAALAGAAPPPPAPHADWRPHAAALLANPTHRPDLDLRTLIHLGDTLHGRGAVYGAQFVWVCAGAGWAPHPLAPHPPRAAPAAPGAAPARLSLLLADPRATSFAALLTPHALLATEVFEYARSLAQGAGGGAGAGAGGGFALAELQVYRLGAALALADAGQYTRALAYAEAAARAVALDPARYPPAFLRALAHLADRLKYEEPAAAAGLAPDAEGDCAHQWILELQALAHQAHAQVSPAPAPAAEAPQFAEHSSPLHQQHQPPEQHYWDQSQHYQQQQQQQQPPLPPQQQQQQGEVTSRYLEATPPPPSGAEYAGYAPPDDQQQYYNNAWPPPDREPPAPPSADAPAPAPAPAYTDYTWHQEQYSYGEGGASPTITMPGAASAGSAGSAGGAGGGARARNAYGDYDDDRPYGNNDENAEQEASEGGKGGQPSKKRAEKAEGAGGGGGGGKAGGSGWLGGLFTKLSLRPPNQMILPDDKNPTIVWDEQRKRWRNTDGEEEAEQPPPPPPTARDLAPLINRQSGSGSPPLQATPGAPPPAPPVSNIFKMQKGRHIKKSYVDVFNPPGAGGTAPRPPAAEVLGPAPPALGAAPRNYFVPAAAPAQQHAHAHAPDSVQLEVRVPTPAPSAAPPTPPSPHSGGIYDPNQIEDDQYRSGI